jgi:hypothetical protein
MQVLLASNILEHPGFFEFVAQTGEKHPQTPLLVTGDLLNIFPEPGEDLAGSIFYELYGDMMIREMDRLVETRFQQIEQSAFIAPLREMFLPTGKTAGLAQQKARQRYEAFFRALSRALGERHCHFIPGNMDYPLIAAGLLGAHPHIHQLDCGVVDFDGITVAGLGGIPNTAHPFRQVVEISPYEMTQAEYERRLHALRGVDVLMTHISPEEYPPLLDFLTQSPLKLLICRAPFDFRRASDFRGKLELQTIGDGLTDDESTAKAVIRVRPFDFPENRAFLVNLALGCTTGDWPSAVETLVWNASQALQTGSRSS